MIIKMTSVTPSPTVTASHLAVPLQILWSCDSHSVSMVQLADSATTEATPQPPMIIVAILHNSIACMYPDCRKTLFRNKTVPALAAAMVKR